jgi:hypothetical protein
VAPPASAAAATASPAAQSVTSTNYAAQAALSTALAGQVAQAWPLLQQGDPNRSSLIVAGALVPVVQQHAMASRALANEYYYQQRAGQGIVEPFLAQPTELPTKEKVYQYVQWATKPAREAAEDTRPLLLIPAQQRATGALQKLVTDTGRQQLVQNTLADRRATGWAREARPDSCWFCAMLATRGAVYKSAWAAGRRTYLGVDTNSYHTHCHCAVEPLFGGTYTAPAHVQEWEQLWKDSTSDVRGKKKLAAFKAAFRGQEAGDAPEDRGTPAKPATPDAPSPFAAWDDERLQAAIDTAQQQLAQHGEAHLGGKRSDWIAKLLDEQARRAA